MTTRLPAAALASLIQLRGMLLADDWDGLSAALRDATLSIKGTIVTLVGLERFLHMRRFEVQCLVLETVLDLKTSAERIELTGRFAMVGLKGRYRSRDGLIFDAALQLVRTGSCWVLTGLHVRCPPDPTQWKNRPNQAAPIDYSNPDDSYEDLQDRHGIVDGCPVNWLA